MRADTETKLLAPRRLDSDSSIDSPSGRLLTNGLQIAVVWRKLGMGKISMFMNRDNWMQSLDLKPSVRAPANSPKAENDTSKFGWQQASLRHDLATLGRILADEYMGSDSPSGISDQAQNHVQRTKFALTILRVKT